MRPDSQRVVITGIGVVSPIGIGKDAFWQGLKEGRSGIKPVTLFDTTTTRSKLAGEISDFKPEEILGEKGLRNLDRTTKLALCAAKLALDDAKFEVTEENTHDVGVVLGSTMGSVWSTSEYDKQSLSEGPRSVNPALFSNTVINSPSSHVSIRFGIKGFNTTISTGFSSGLDALKYAADFLRFGRAKAVLVGGAEELCEQIFKGFYKLGLLSGSGDGIEEINCPFDSRRNGIVIGEGAGFFLIETGSHALGRSARIYGDVTGFGAAFDYKSANRLSLKSDNAEKSIINALTNSKSKPDEFKCIISSANSSIEGDIIEASAVNKVFKGNSRLVLMPACKSMTGELYSASGAIEVAEALFVLNQSFVPPTINYMRTDSRCAVDCVPNKGREISINKILLNSFGLTGQNSSLVIEKETKYAT